MSGCLSILMSGSLSVLMSGSLSTLMSGSLSDTSVLPSHPSVWSSSSLNNSCLEVCVGSDSHRMDRTIPIMALGGIVSSF